MNTRAFQLKSYNDVVDISHKEMSPLDLIIKITETLILNIEKAKLSITEKNNENRIFYTNKAIQILNEGLIEPLNLDRGEVAQNLLTNYWVCTQNLINGNINKDLILYNKAQEQLEIILSAWKDIK